MGYTFAWSPDGKGKSVSIPIIGYAGETAWKNKYPERANLGEVATGNAVGLGQTMDSGYLARWAQPDTPDAVVGLINNICAYGRTTC